MSDISTLNLSVDSSKAKQQLKQFNSELNRTSEAGQRLIGTLKSIGVTVRIYCIS